MEEINEICTFKAINEDIKATLSELKEHICAHPYFDYSEMSKNHDAFIEMLDKLFEARCAVENLKKHYC